MRSAFFFELRNFAATSSAEAGDVKAARGGLDGGLVGGAGGFHSRPANAADAREQLRGVREQVVFVALDVLDAEAFDVFERGGDGTG
jgi:hypothetical protein